jgi:hypothetical protein
MIAGKSEWTCLNPSADRAAVGSASSTGGCGCRFNAAGAAAVGNMFRIGIVEDGAGAAIVHDHKAWRTNGSDRTLGERPPVHVVALASEENSMINFKILTAAVVAASAIAISPSIAQQHGGARAGGAAVSAPSAGATAGATAGPGRTSVAPAANMQAPQVNAAAGAPGGTWHGRGSYGGTMNHGAWNGGTWNGGHVAANGWNGNWNGRGFDRDHDRGFRRGPGFAFGFGAGPGYYPYDDYAYYDDPYYSDTYAYDTGPAVGVTVGTGNGGDVEYCMQRYRSYDPASGTFLGYDGIRHPCP